MNMVYENTTNRRGKFHVQRATANRQSLSLSPGRFYRRPSASTTVFRNLASGRKYLTVAIVT